MCGPAHFDDSVLLYAGVTLFNMLACEKCGFCDWVILGALGLSRVGCSRPQGLRLACFLAQVPEFLQFFV